MKISFRSSDLHSTFVLLGPRQRARVPELFAAILVCAISLGASAQQWKDELRAEKARNATRLTAIDAQGEPIAAKLRENTQAIARHNASPCTYPQGHPEACAAYEREKVQLNTDREKLRSQLQPLADESDRLLARNNEIDRRLRCVSIPNACKSNSDCNECSVCGTFDGRGDTGTCHPRP